MKNKIGYSVLLFTLMGCSFFGETTNFKENEAALAKVGNQYLYSKDLDGVGEGLEAKDSVRQVNAYVQKWVHDELMLQVAKRNIDASEKIEQMVQTYKASLIMNQYENALIRERLDEKVTAQQIGDYFAKHKDQYIAQNAWIRCLFVKVSVETPDVNQLRKWFKSNDGADFERIKLYCAQNPTEHILNESLWVDYELLAQKIPKNYISSRNLGGKGIVDYNDGKFHYLMQVMEFSKKGESIPLVKVQEDIKRILIHNRRNAILASIRKDVYENAKKTCDFEVY